MTPRASDKHSQLRTTPGLQPDAADPDRNTFYKNIVEAEAT